MRAGVVLAGAGLLGLAAGAALWLGGHRAPEDPGAAGPRSSLTLEGPRPGSAAAGGEAARAGENAPTSEPAAAPMRKVRVKMGDAYDPPPSQDDPALRDPQSALYRRYFVYDEEYYATVDPTRIYVQRPLAPGEAPLPRLKAASAVDGEGRPNEAYARPLAVQATPGLPVTFFASDFGAFQNDHRAITVKADEEGVARADFTFGETSSYYRVVAASPEARGWVVFNLTALSEEEVEELARLEGGER